MNTFPTELLSNDKTGLCLFGAGFLGRNDAIHMRDAGMHATVVDIDEMKMQAMKPLYPVDWDFTTADVWVYAQLATQFDLTWDVVSVDPPVALLDRAVEDIGLWLSLTDEVLVLTCSTSVEPKMSGDFHVKDSLIRSTIGNTQLLVITR